MAMEGFQPPAPFLTKTFDMVDDSLTDAVISWSPTCDSSFVVWDFYEFSRTLLPLFFKHSNFSSFVRQLNTYGFRKSQPQRWEFSNEEFRKGQRHRLKNIVRKRPDTARNSVAIIASAHLFAHAGMPFEQGWNGDVSRHQAAHGAESGFEKQLRCEMNEIKLELHRLDSQHQAAHHQIKYLSDYQHILEMRQKQMVAIVAHTLCAPALLYQYVNDATEADHIQARQGLLEEAHEMVDGNSNAARKRRCIMHSDSSEFANKKLIEQEQRQLQSKPQGGEECRASCDKTSLGTAAVTASGNEDRNEMFGYDQKQINIPKKCSSSMCLSNEVNGNGNTAASFYQSMAITKAEDSVSSAFSGIVEDVKVDISLTQPGFQGHCFYSEADEHLDMVDMTMQLFNLTDSVFSSSGAQTETRQSQVSKDRQSASFSNNFDDMESELFWERLLSPAIACKDFSGSRDAFALIDYPGLDG